MVEVDLNKCDQCGTCISVCPVSAIMMLEEIVIDKNACINCGKCVKVCPFGALNCSK